MKKRIGIVSISILLVLVLLIALATNNNTSNTFKQDGVTYALVKDGVKVSSIPTKALYKVTVDCTNARGKWDYDNWKLYIDNITGDVSCNLSFDTISKTYLNNYIISLAGTTQGTGQVVNEMFSTTVDNSTFTSATTLEQSSYTITNMETTSDSNDAFVWDSTNKNWTSQNHTASTTTNGGIGMSFTVPNGYYQLCYTMSSEKNYDYGIVYINGTEKFNTKGKDTSEYCEYLGNLTTSDVIRISYRKDSSGDTGNDNIIFYLQSGSYNEDITTQNYDTGYRYEGKNPNNYIWFNNELWRIIGVFDENSHGQSGLNLVKIIRNDSIGGLAWHKSNTNDWTAASLNSLLNGAYYNAQDGTGGTYCYGYSTSVPSNCDYTEIGIQDNYRNMIKNVTWYLGGYSSTSATTESFYGYERGTTVYSGRPTSTTGYIGLMYPSDYGYSVLSSSCARTTNLGSYSTSSCAGQSWLYGQGYEWTLTPDSSNSDYVFYVFGWGFLANCSANYGYAARPSLYLEAGTYVVDGDGSMSNPYIIGM